MRGDLMSTWKLSWQEVWLLIQAEPEEEEDALRMILEGHELPQDFEPHNDLFAALYQEAVKALKKEIKEKIGFKGIAVDNDSASNLFQGIEHTDFESELSLVQFFEDAYETLSDYDELLPQRFLLLLKGFTSKYNLRYEIDGEGHITPTIPGLFTSLFDEMLSIGESDDDVRNLLLELSHAYRDLKADKSESRIKAYIHRLTNLIESIASKHPETTMSTLGKASKELKTWPHAAIQLSLSNLYGFTSDFPGIRHAGNSSARLRNLDMRDMIALTIIFAGYMPYLSDRIDCENLYLSARKE